MLQRGGARPGAGAKRKPDTMLTRAFVLRADQVAWLELRAAEANTSKSESLRLVIDFAMQHTLTLRWSR